MEQKRSREREARIEKKGFLAKGERETDHFGTMERVFPLKFSNSLFSGLRTREC